MMNCIEEEQEEYSLSSGRSGTISFPSLNNMYAEDEEHIMRPPPSLPPPPPPPPPPLDGATMSPDEINGCGVANSIDLGVDQVSAESMQEMDDIINQLPPNDHHDDDYDDDGYPTDEGTLPSYTQSDEKERRRLSILQLARDRLAKKNSNDVPTDINHGSEDDDADDDSSFLANVEVIDLGNPPDDSTFLDNADIEDVLPVEDDHRSPTPRISNNDFNDQLNRSDRTDSDDSDDNYNDYDVHASTLSRASFSTKGGGSTIGDQILKESTMAARMAGNNGNDTNANTNHHNGADNQSTKSEYSYRRAYVDNVTLGSNYTSTCSALTDEYCFDARKMGMGMSEAIGFKGSIREDQPCHDDDIIKRSTSFPVCADTGAMIQPSDHSGVESLARPPPPSLPNRSPNFAAYENSDHLTRIVTFGDGDGDGWVDERAAEKYANAERKPAGVGGGGCCGWFTSSSRVVKLVISFSILLMLISVASLTLAFLMPREEMIGTASSATSASNGGTVDEGERNYDNNSGDDYDFVEDASSKLNDTDTLAPSSDSPTPAPFMAYSTAAPSVLAGMATCEVGAACFEEGSQCTDGSTETCCGEIFDSFVCDCAKDANGKLEYMCFFTDACFAPSCDNLEPPVATLTPSKYPEVAPTSSAPTVAPNSSVATLTPSRSPELAPTSSPPTVAPTSSVTSLAPSMSPQSLIFSTSSTTESPTGHPSMEPTVDPTKKPTQRPTEQPTAKPTESPTKQPSVKPTLFPTQKPTKDPTAIPTIKLTPIPTEFPVNTAPTLSPSSSDPTPIPTEFPTSTAPTLSPASSAPTTTRALTQTVTLKAIQDTYVNTTAPHLNYGVKKQIRIDASPRCWAFIEFDTTSIVVKNTTQVQRQSQPVEQNEPRTMQTTQVLKATLRLYTLDEGGGGGIFALPNAKEWPENGLTWNEIGQIDRTEKISLFSNNWFDAFQWYEIDVTDAFRNFGSNAVRSFMIKSYSTNGVAFASRNKGSGEFSPQLVLDFPAGTDVGTRSPTPGPSLSPSKRPTETPTTASPTYFPTSAPSEHPIPSPTRRPTTRPSPSPTSSPLATDAPTNWSSVSPRTTTPSEYPTPSPTRRPTTRPSQSTTSSPLATDAPTNWSSVSPSKTQTPPFVPPGCPAVADVNFAFKEVLMPQQNISHVHVVFPSQDSYVSGGSYSDENYGSSDSLVLKSSTTRVLFEFDLGLNTLTSSMQNIVSISLRLFVESVSDGRSISIYKLPTSVEWEEEQVTWNNFGFPAMERAGPIFEVESSDGGKWIDVDITDLSEGGSVNKFLFAVKNTSASSEAKECVFASRETCHSSKLVIITESSD